MLCINNYQLIIFFKGGKKLRYKKLMMLTIFLISLLAVSAVSATDNATDDIVGVEETTDTDADFDKNISECCSFVIQEENETVFAFRQDAPLNGYGVTIHNDFLGDQEMIIQEIDRPGAHFIHAMICENGWIASHGGDSRNISKTMAIESLLQDMILSENISTDAFDQIQNFLKKDHYGHVFIKGPDGSYGVAFHQTCLFGKLEPGDYLIIPNVYSGFRKGIYHDYSNDPVDAIVMICSFENSGWNRRNLYTYDYKPHDTPEGKKYGVDVYVTNDNGNNVGLNTSKIVTYCYFNDKFFPESIIPENPDKLYIGTYIFENRSTGSVIQVLNHSDSVLVNSETSVHYRVMNVDDEITVVFELDDKLEFVDAKVSQGDCRYDSLANNVNWHLSPSEISPEIILNVRPKLKGLYNILSYVNGSDHKINVTGYATDYGVIVRAEDIDTYKSYFMSLDVYLTDNDEFPLFGEKVSIEIDGNVRVCAVTPGGYASLATTMQVGEYEALISYDGVFGKNQTTAKIIVRKTLLTSDVEEYYGQATLFNVTALDEEGNTLKKDSDIDFRLDGTLISRQVMDDGICTLDISKLKPGNHSVTTFNIRTNEIENNSIYIKEPVCDLNIEKTADHSSVHVGETIEWTVNVFNRGPCDAHDVMVMDNLHPAFKFVSYNASKGDYNSTSGKWNISDLANGENVTLHIICIILEEGLFTNEATLTCRENDTSVGCAATVDVHENDEPVIPPEPQDSKPHETTINYPVSKKSSESAKMFVCGNPIACLIMVFMIFSGGFSIQKRKR